MEWRETRAPSLRRRISRLIERWATRSAVRPRSASATIACASKLAAVWALSRFALYSKNAPAIAAAIKTVSHAGDAHTRVRETLADWPNRLSDAEELPLSSTSRWRLNVS